MLLEFILIKEVRPRPCFLLLMVSFIDVLDCFAVALRSPS
jgi:hypothetical protein